MRILIKSGMVYLITLVLLLGITYACTSTDTRGLDATQGGSAADRIREDVQLYRRVLREGFESVRIVSYNRAIRGGYRSYENLRLSEIVFDDPQLIEIFYGVLRENIERAGTTSSGEVNHTVIFITKAGNYIECRLRTNQSTGNQIHRILSEYDEVRQILLTLPEAPLEISTGSRMVSDFPAEYALEIYEILKKEVLSLEFDDWFELLQNFGRRHDWRVRVPFYDTIIARGMVGEQEYTSVYPITGLTPNTANLFIQHANALNFYSMIDAIETIITYGQGIEYEMRIIRYSGHGNTVGEPWGTAPEPSSYEALLEAIRAQSNQSVNVQMPHYRLIVEIWENTSLSETYISPLSSDISLLHNNSAEVMIEPPPPPPPILSVSFVFHATFWGAA